MAERAERRGAGRVGRRRGRAGRAGRRRRRPARAPALARPARGTPRRRLLRFPTGPSFVSHTFANIPTDLYGIRWPVSNFSSRYCST